MSDFLDDRLAALGSTPVPTLAPAELIRRRGEQRRARGRLVAGAAGLALVVAAGATAYGVTTGHDDGALQYAPQPSSQPSPAPSGTGPAAVVAQPDVPGDVVLAVGGGVQTRPDGVATTTSLSLYRLDGGVSAEPVRTLLAPRAGAQLDEVSLSAGPTPTTCAIWDPDPQNPDDGVELRCYLWGDSRGFVVQAAGSDPADVALSADGRSLAWVDNNNANNPTLAIGQVDGAQVTGIREYLGDPTQPATAFTGSGADGLAWAGPSALAIGVVADSDEGLGLVRFVPGSTTRGWTEDKEAVVPLSPADRQRGYHVYDGVRSATSTTAWAIERRNYVYAPKLVAKRAVEIELPSGRVKQVVSEPAEGRDVVEVSGGPRAVVYVTAASDGSNRRVYVRYPGQPRGTEVTGLPDNPMVVAGG